MKQVLNAFFATLIITLYSCSTAPHQVTEIAVIPAVQSVEYANGLHKLDKNISIAYPEELQKEAQLLQSYLIQDQEINSKFRANKTKGDIVLSINSAIGNGNKEAYQLNITKKRITLEGASAAGVFYGIQTLRQIIKDDKTIEQLTINDEPAYGWRSYMLDEARNFQGKEEVKKLLDEMARLKMNTFHWHLTDDQGWRIEIKKYPKLTEVGGRRDSTEINHFHSNVFDPNPHVGFYTQDDIKELVAYATDRHINVIPEIEIPGHATASVAAYPWLGTTGKEIKVSCRYGVHYEAYDVSNPKTFEFINDVLDEVITLFPSEVIHIGGDEVKYDNWKKSDGITRLMKELNIKSYPELQVWVTNQVSKMLTEKGRRMMGWNEITGDQLHAYQTEKVENQNQQLAEGTVVQFWAGNPDLARKSAEKGYLILNSHNIWTYLDYDYNSIPLEKAYAFNPIPEGLPKEFEKKILGLGCQMWGEFTNSTEKVHLKTFPRIAAYAETGWTKPENKNFEKFKQALPKLKAAWTASGIQYHEETKK